MTHRRTQGSKAEGLGSKSGGLAHGRGLDEGLGSKSGGLAHGSGAVEALVSKQGGLAHGRGPDEGLGSKQGGLAHGSGAVEILFQKVSENRLADRRSGGATEGAAGRPPKGFAAKEGV